VYGDTGGIRTPGNALARLSHFSHTSHLTIMTRLLVNLNV